MTGRIEFGGACPITAVYVDHSERPVRRPSGFSTRPFESKRSGGSELRGFATLWVKPHNYKGAVDVFMPGCFARTITRGNAIRLLIDHDESKCIATTADNLEVFSDDTGLAFRCALPAGSLSAIGGRREMSVGYEILAGGTEEREISGHKVRMIRDAELREISIVKEGAVRQAFAILGPSTKSKSLREVCASGALLMDGATHKLELALRKFAETVGAA